MFSKLTPNHQQEAYKSLTRGLRELDFDCHSVPNDLVLIGDHAFPIAMSSQGQVLMAASLYGRGRIVVLGHETYLTMFPALVENALTWLRGDKSDNLNVGIHRSVQGVTGNLSKSNFHTEVVGAFRKDLGVGVYVTDAYSVGEDHKDLVAFMKAGGGVLIGGQAWYWSSQHPKENPLLQFDGNKVSGVAGIYFTACWSEKECLPVYPQIPSSWKALTLGKDFKEDLEFLLQGVSEFDLRDDSVPSEILVHGPLAFPIGTTEDERVFLAGAYYGQGRVIVISHEGYLGLENMAPFWMNALQWLDEGRQGVVGVAPGVSLDVLSKSELTCERTNFKEGLSVFVRSAYSDDHVEEIQNFVAEGGGLLIGGHAWYWEQSQSHHGQNVLADFAGNKLLNIMGLSILGKTISGDLFKAPAPSQNIRDGYHFRHLLRCFAGHINEGKDLTKHEEKYLRKLGSDCAHYLDNPAPNGSSYIQVLSTLTGILMRSEMPQVSVRSPVKSPEKQLLLSVAANVYKVCPDPEVLLPYLVKIEPLKSVVYNHRITINVDTAGGEEWISTGLYLPPGMKTYMVLPAEIINKGWQIQIGCQTDYLNAEELKRAPVVHEQFSITSELMQVWNLWGGLIYLIAPPKTKMDGVEVIVQMAVPAPYYKAGVTTTAEWTQLRTAPSPWAELEFDNIILTVQSEHVRKLEHPDELAALWNDIMRNIADLAAIPHKFPRKERIVIDAQISAGWMHSGYPIMGQTSTAVELVNIDIARQNLWGPIHELGHNQQRGCWEFPPHTTECTCNLWSVYVHEEVLGVSRDKAHPSLTPEERSRRIKDYVKGGKNLSGWTVWVALETYLQLQEKFGWEAFKKVFAAYHKMSKFPKNNRGKMNLYAKTFSQAVEMNLAGFFKAWGWPIKTTTEEKLSDLPPWRDHPMAQE